MSWLTIISIYLIVWWLVLFTILPIGVRTAEEAGVEKGDGHASGAPIKPMLWWKALATSIISAVIVGTMALLSHYHLVDFRALLLGS